MKTIQNHMKTSGETWSPSKSDFPVPLLPLQPPNFCEDLLVDWPITLPVEGTGGNGGNTLLLCSGLLGSYTYPISFNTTPWIINLSFTWFYVAFI